MSNILATEADLLRVGFIVGYFEKADIICWADRQIEACDDPPTDLLDLSVIRETHPIDVVNLLRSLGSPVLPTSIDTHIGFLGLLYAEGAISTEHVIRWFYALVHEPGITQEKQDRIYYLDDGYDLALTGYGSMDDIERELGDFVAPYAHQLADNHPQLMSRQRHH